jgi:VIT1/CCC1 family predicted Fe2+/Mn2+ transporter
MKRANAFHKQLAQDHDPQEIGKRLDAPPEYSYMRDLIYGSVDGAVTSFAVVAGVTGAVLPAGVVVIVGLANLLADGFSMGASNYLGSRAEEQRRAALRRSEEEQVRVFPAGEREEIRQIYSRRGISGRELELVVDAITANEERWVTTMMTEELRLSSTGPSPVRSGLSTFLAFVVCGLLPLLPYLIEISNSDLIQKPFIWSATATGLAFTVVGAGKGLVVGRSWYASAFETAGLGGLAAALAYLVGLCLQGVVT